MAEKDKIGKYRVLGKIGEGGMGKIFKAQHPTLNRTIIIKQLSFTKNKSLTQRFKREAKIMIDLRNENIVQVYDHFREGNSYYIAMEFVDGTSLEKLITSKSKICPTVALLILKEICKGLKHAHDKGIVHRDIKPDNVLISKSGEVKLVDFGIATAQEDNEEDLTKTGAIMGTPAYMSPEQLTSTKHVDHRSDIYSIGVLFYKMVTGEKPFSSNFTAEAIHNITKGIYTRPEKLNPQVPGIFRKIIHKTMNHKVGKRYKDLRYLINLLDKFTYRYKTQQEINNAIKDYTTKKESDMLPICTLPVKPKTNLFLRIISIAAGIFLVYMFGFFMYNQGYYYEIFGSYQWGVFSARIQLPEKYYKDLDQVFSQVVIKSVTDSAAKPVKLPVSPYNDLFFWSNNEINKAKYKIKHLLTTQKLYLKPGYYKADIIVEDKKFSQSFYIDPRMIQKSRKATYFGKVLDITIPPSAPRKVDFSYNVIDAETGESIVSRAKVLFFHKGEWWNWKNHFTYLLTTIFSGGTYKMLCEVPGYYSKTIDFKIEDDVDSFNLLIELGIGSGDLVINSSEKGIEILIDNRKEYYLGDEIKKIMPFGNTIAGKKEFKLKAGKYTLTFRKNGRVLVNHDFYIAINQSLNLKLIYNANTKKWSVLSQ
ncbi:MAG: serine/threonine protein kinase [Spirochaetales bacterium]|nr:serine/threonine protein kinase [Spirochaetales bacterium]